jgi:uncharacterized damage-inducible protein DinB
MSEFSNLAGRSRAEADAYVASLLALLADRDPLAVLEELPGALAEATRGLDEAALRRPEAPGKWSIMQVVQHLADSDLVSGYRLRLTIAQPGSPIQGYDQDLWVRELRYDEASLADALEQLTALRRANLRLLRSLDAAGLARSGVHSERGPESVDKLMRLIAGHDLVHRRQIERIRRATSGPAAGG